VSGHVKVALASMQQLLQLMDTDKDGKVSKAEYIESLSRQPGGGPRSKLRPVAVQEPA
jgi:hypothetical protein